MNITQFEQKLKEFDDMRAELKEKLEKGEKAKFSEKDINLLEKVYRGLNGDLTMGSDTVSQSLKEAITSTDVMKLIPKIIEGKVREGAEPVYLASKFFDKVNVDKGSSVTYVIPVVGEMNAFEVAEGARYQESSLDYTTLEASPLEIRVSKVGAKISITEEALKDASWDIYGISAKKMGRAMARFKEEKCYNAFSTHGHVIFDNNLREQLPAAGTTGRAEDGSFNDTLSVEDFLDIAIAMLANDKTPTDVIMHPLCWIVFAQNSMIGNGLTFGALGGQNIHPWGATQGTPGFAGLAANQGPQKFVITPDQVQNRLPLPMTMNLSPYVKFDKAQKKFDMYVLDRNEVGIIAQKEELSLDTWTDPERDVSLMKMKEIYGVGLLNNGRNIALARNIAVAPTYPKAPRVEIAHVQ